MLRITFQKKLLQANDYHHDNVPNVTDFFFK